LITAATCPYRKKLDFILQGAGQLSMDTMEIGSMTALQHYVQRGLGIALVPEIMVNPLPEGTTVRAIGGAEVDMQSGMLSRSGEHPLKCAAANIYRFLEKELRQN